MVSHTAGIRIAIGMSATIQAYQTRLAAITRLELVVYNVGEQIGDSLTRFEKVLVLLLHSSVCLPGL